MVPSELLGQGDEGTSIDEKNEFSVEIDHDNERTRCKRYHNVALQTELAEKSITPSELICLISEALVSFQGTYVSL